ncbi:MAG: TonB-dependent receptor [Bacteroidia bacterium]|nr:TonB-dependent receptor [Bacteroidia bacterium]
MKKNVTVVAALLAANVVVCAQKTAPDSLRVINLQEVQVMSTRATAKTPVAFTNVQKEQLSKQNFGKDIPFLLSLTPSVITTSDAGAGIGYTGIRVRGTDPSRINVTTNGIPMNDAESHSIYWVNTPDFASSLEDLQIQRGAGTSTNGSGAFGGSINMRTQGIPSRAYSEVSGSYGSFNTHKETVKVGTGLINKYWAFDARLSNIQSDGYRDRASSDLKSYFVQGGFFGEKATVKFISFGGKEKTYHAWDGISKKQLETDRTYNPNGEIEDNTGKNVVGFYDDQMDNYRQTHYQLLADYLFSNTWSLNVGLHYTNGFGFYQEYKNGRTLKEYGLQPYYLPEKPGVEQEKANLVRKKNVGSDFYGGVFSLNYKGEKLSATLGGGANRYTSDHYGNVIWVKNYTAELTPDHEYYRNEGAKTDGNVYLKADYELAKGLNAYADMQFRHIRYTISGRNDNWDWTAEPGEMQRLNLNEHFNFFNPKAGLFWQMNKNQTVYASFSVAQKEPTRNNYTDGLFNQHPKAEKMFDYELGYTFRNERFTAGLNLYYMAYKDQLVLNGKLNEIGELMAENVEDSYRMGIEASIGAKLTKWLRWDINGTLSKNQIKNYVGYVSDYNANNWKEMYTQTAINKGNTTIAFSPSFIGNSLISLSYHGFDASLQSQYVSRQYLDNFEMKENSLDAYFVHHLNIAYTFKAPYTQGITAGLSIYNLLNTTYETNGYSQTAALYKDGDKKSNKPVLSSDPRFYPMAGTNVLAHLTVRF